MTGQKKDLNEDITDVEPKAPKATIEPNPEGDVSGELGARAAYEGFLREYEDLLKRIFASKELLIDEDLVDMITDDMHEKLDTALTEYYDKSSSDGLNVDDIDDADEA